MVTEQVTQIAKLNDAFRRGGFGVTITHGVQELDDVAGLLRVVRTFDTFTEDNDPYGEHDFGSIVWQDQKFFWKIDYYKKGLDGWYDPVLPECQRVLTVMLAREY